MIGEAGDFYFVGADELLNVKHESLAVARAQARDHTCLLLCFRLIMKGATAMRKLFIWQSRSSRIVVC